MSTFKIGDIVECVEQGLTGVTFGKVYEVIKVGCSFVTVINDKNMLSNYYPERFKLYEAEDVVSPEQHIKGFLNKLKYVLLNDNTVGSLLEAMGKDLHIETDVSTIYGIDDIYTYINASYDQLTSQVAQKRKLELEAKRLKVLDELSAIDQELGGYDAN